MVDLASIKLAYPIDLDRVLRTQNFSLSHPGVDWGSIGAVKIPILAAAESDVKASGWDTTGYGNRIILDHGDYETLYGHLDSISVSLSDHVQKGDQIGVMGTTGNSTGVHVHFELRVPNLPVSGLLHGQRDPFPFFEAIGPTPISITIPLTVGKLAQVTASWGLYIHSEPNELVSTRLVCLPMGSKLEVSSLEDSEWATLIVYASKKFLEGVS